MFSVYQMDRGSSSTYPKIRAIHKILAKLLTVKVDVLLEINNEKMLLAQNVINVNLEKQPYRVWCLWKGLFKFYNISKFQANLFINNRDMGDRGIATTSKRVYCSLLRHRFWSIAALGTQGQMQTGVWDSLIATLELKG